MRVVIVSERRADYSRFKPILSLMKGDAFFEYHLIVTGISLLKSRGEDIKIIERDGFTVHTTVPMFKEHSPDTGVEMTKAYSRVMMGLSETFEKIKPDLILTGFDIGANFVAAIIGAHMNIPVAHIQGGEVTGSIDESLRHATSKFAHIHFPATNDAAKRLMKMGEDRRFIFKVGCPSIDTLLAAPVMKKSDVYKLLKLDPRKPYVLIVQHPVTTEVKDTDKQIKETLEAVKALGIQGVILYPNNDAGSRAIVKNIRHSNIHFFRSLAPDVFANVLRYSAALVGNSSSGIHETASLYIPTVNIGSRQQGRKRPGNVIDAPYKRAAIKKAIEKALYDKQFIRKVKSVKNIYGDGKSAPRIVKILKKLDLRKVPIQKRFID